MVAIDQYDSGLPSLPESGQVSESRLGTAEDCRNLVLLYFQNDQQRNQKRSLVDGLVQGNPPYRRSALVSAGRGDACNVNWRTAEAFEDNAVGAIYDIFSEAETYTTITHKGRDANTAVEWGNIITEEFQVLQGGDRSWDAVMQNSIRSTVRFGAGPVMFESKLDWHVRYVPFNYLQVPDDASSDVNQWEVAAVRVDYLAHQLYEFIRNPEAASEVGWDVEATKQAIINAAPDIGNNPNVVLSWEWVQQQLKQNSFSFSARSKIIQAIHFFAREFPEKGESTGKISCVIFVLSPQAGRANQSGKADNNTQFLYKSLRTYDRWQECVHPMYYSQGQGGKHYGVTGMGVKMYGALEAQNRLLCNAYDKAFAPKIMFKPTSASGKQRSLPQRMGDYQYLPDGYEMQQVAIGSMIEDQVVLNREISGLVSANLSTYRQNLDQPKSGNPLTAREVEVRAADQARLGKTQLNRYYEQLDWLYEERYRRACNPNLTESDPGGKEALEFQKRCLERGVPTEELLNYCSVKATRVVGQGSPYLREQSLQKTLMVLGRLPEDGQAHVIKDFIAAANGQFMVNRYYPTNAPSRLVQDQRAGAASQVADMKVGVPAVWSPSQDPLIYASTFMQAASGALGSLAQSPPQALPQTGPQVIAFLDLIGPATAAHLQRLANDPTRQQEFKILSQQFKQLSSAADKLKQQTEKATQDMQLEMAQRQQATQQTMSDQQLAWTKARNQAQVKQANAQVNAGIKQRKAAQEMALSDARTASEIDRAAAETEASIRNQTIKTAAEVRSKRMKAENTP